MLLNYIRVGIKKHCSLTHNTHTHLFHVIYWEAAQKVDYAYLVEEASIFFRGSMLLFKESVKRRRLLADFGIFLDSKKRVKKQLKYLQELLITS